MKVCIRFNSYTLLQNVYHIKITQDPDYDNLNLCNNLHYYMNETDRN